MPNQLNFPDPLPNALNQRPSRTSNRDRQLFESGNKQILFGTNANDLVEIWIYNSDGSIAGHINVPSTSAILTVSTVIDNTGGYEFLNIDLGEVVREAGLEQGRYALVTNFFRDEVGSETGNQLFIQDISPDRTELRLHPVLVDATILHDIFEWVVPSVPRLEAQGLIDQLFGKSTPPNPMNELTVPKITVEANLLTNNTLTDKLNYSGATGNYATMVSSMIESIYSKTLNNLAEDTKNLNIQDIDLDQYIRQATKDTIAEYKNSGKIDNRKCILRNYKCHF